MLVPAQHALGEAAPIVLFRKTNADDLAEVSVERCLELLTQLLAGEFQDVVGFGGRNCFDV
jgi:hypothetical protein